MKMGKRFNLIMVRCKKTKTKDKKQRQRRYHRRHRRCHPHHRLRYHRRHRLDQFEFTLVPQLQRPVWLNQIK